MPQIIKQKLALLCFLVKRTYKPAHFLVFWLNPSESSIFKAPSFPTVKAQHSQLG
jgi:hypothetical protein